MEAFDVVVGGGGIAGASLAWRLAGRRSVLVLERELQPGYRAQGAYGIQSAAGALSPRRFG